MPEVTFYRSRGWVSRGGSMSIEVDGRPAGTLSYNDRLTVEVAEGSHRVQAKQRSYPSSVLELDLAVDESAIVAVRPSFPQHRTADSVFFTLVRTADYADHGPSFWSVYRDRSPVGYRRLGPRDASSSPSPSVCW